MSTFLKNKTNKPLLIGITGGIGSGKSTITKIFESLAIPAFNSDKEAKNIINTDKEVIKLITAQFGAVYHGEKIDTAKLAQLVFNDSNALKELNKIVHPKVNEKFQAWVNENGNSPLLIQEAAILIESGASKKFDKIILVVAPIEERVKRVVKRDEVSVKQVKERMKAQISDQEKLKYADFCITNDGKQLVIPQVIKVFKQLKSLN